MPTAAGVLVPQAPADKRIVEAPIFTKEHREFLMEHGYVVIPNVVDQVFCEKCIEDLKKVISIWDETLTTKNPSAWSPEKLPAGTAYGINRLVAHSQAQWNVRQHPRVVQCFAEYWSSGVNKYQLDEMVTSMDAFNFYLAASIKSPSPFWAHTDQGRHSKSVLDGKCLQGLVNLISCEGDNDGGLVVWDKGHRAWRGIFEKYPYGGGKGNFYRYLESTMKHIEQDGREFLAREDSLANSEDPVPMKRIRVRAPAGALVLWFSMTPHQNDAPFMRNPSAPFGRDRAAVYVCMCPKPYLVLPKDTKKRKMAFEENRQTSHWPAGGQVEVFSLLSFRARDKEKAKVIKEKIERFRKHPYIKKKPELTWLGKSVLGV